MLGSNWIITGTSGWGFDLCFPCALPNSSTNLSYRIGILYLRRNKVRLAIVIYLFVMHIIIFALMMV